MLIANNPNINPIAFPKALALPEYSLFDSGINSPETMYSIAPAAKLKHIAIIPSEIPPINFPISAHKPVVTPESTT